MRDANSPEVVVEDAMKESIEILRESLIKTSIDALVSKIELKLLIGVLTELLKKYPDIAKEVAKDYGEQ
jgi:hypothetical protein